MWAPSLQQACAEHLTSAQHLTHETAEFQCVWQSRPHGRWRWSPHHHMVKGAGQPLGSNATSTRLGRAASLHRVGGQGVSTAQILKGFCPPKSWDTWPVLTKVCPGPDTHRCSCWAQIHCFTGPLLRPGHTYLIYPSHCCPHFTAKKRRLREARACAIWRVAEPAVWPKVMFLCTCLKMAPNHTYLLST